VIQGILAIMWKEYKETFAKRGMRSAIPLLVLPIVVLGIFLPWQMGKDWLISPVTMLMWAWLPAFVVISIVADSFAGERERHTLETLLASRLSDRAILFGKIGYAIIYSWGITLVGMVVALLTVNLLYGNGGLLWYSTDTLLIGTTLSLLVATLVTTGGCLISLRASTVRQAQQTISMLFMVPWFALMFGAQLIPADWTAGVSAVFSTMSFTSILALAEVLLAIVDAGLIAVTMARFKRAKLAID
jgi:ABC-2 type transport system permease protein